MAAQMQNKGRLLVHDAITSRMRRTPSVRCALVSRLSRRLPHDLRGLEGQCDLVVADVPCSGTGRWRRAPETKWRLTAQGLADMNCGTGILRQGKLSSPQGNSLLSLFPGF